MLMHNKATGDVNSIAACFHSWPRPAGQWWGSGQHGEIKQKLTKALGEAEVCMPEKQYLVHSMWIFRISNNVWFLIKGINKRDNYPSPQILNQENMIRLAYENCTLTKTVTCILYCMCTVNANFLQAWNNQKICYICQNVQYKTGISGNTVSHSATLPASPAISTVPNEPKATSTVILTTLWLFHQKFRQVHTKTRLKIVKLFNYFNFLCLIW